MELFNKKSIANAAYITHSLTVKKDAVTRLKKYVGQASPRDEADEHDLEWTPCRYDTKGWKYIKQGTVQPHLNNTHKINITGGYGPA